MINPNAERKGSSPFKKLEGKHSPKWDRVEEALKKQFRKAEGRARARLSSLI
jgi:hypothetical protein